ncbi:unnamed protein product, partial [Aphanomyces euteiches]
MQAQYECQLREYEYQMELQKRDRHVDTIKQEATQFVSHAQETGNAKIRSMEQAMQQMLLQQRQLEDEIKLRQEVLKQAFHEQLQQVQEEKQQWMNDIIAKMQTKNAASQPFATNMGNPVGNINMDNTSGGLNSKIGVEPQILQHGFQAPGGILLSGYSAPKAPKYNGYTLDARRAFALDYMEYIRSVREVSNDTQTPIACRPIGTCMEAQAKLFAAEFHIQKPVDDITDMEWMAYFQIGLEHVHTQYADIALKIKKSVVMNEKEMDAEKRMDRWIRDYWQILTKNHMLDYGKRHPKAAVKALLEGVRPEGLRESLRQELEHDMKYLRNDVVEFFNYVRSELRHTLKYLRASGQAGYKDREQKVKAHKAQEKAKNQNPNGRDAKNVNRDVEKNKRKPVCWYCGNDHRLVDCTLVSEAEKDAIAKKKLAEWRAQENARAERSKSKVLHSVPTNSGTYLASIRGVDGVGAVPTLFDSGADPCAMISRGLLEYMQQAATIDLRLVTLEDDKSMWGFGNVPVKVYRHIVLPAIDILTPSGPLALLNVNAWIEETEDMPALTIGRPIMETL